MEPPSPTPQPTADRASGSPKPTNHASAAPQTAINSPPSNETFIPPQTSQAGSRADQPTHAQDALANHSSPRPSHKPRAYSSSPQEAVHSILASARPPKPAPKPRSRSSVVSRSKLHQNSLSSDGLKPLNTHSPIAVAAAAAVTADKIRKLLIAQGPLPIRHITSHLASTIAGFGELSLSKQRRLIIAVLDGPKSEFVKVGWGRWAVGGQGSGTGPDITQYTAATSRSAFGSSHRESISRQLPDSKPPLSPSLGPVEESAVFSDSESSEFEDDSEVEGTDEEDWQAIGPTQLRQTSPREQDAIAALVQLRSN